MPGEPLFRLHGILDGEDILIEAGRAGYFMDTDERLDFLGQEWYKGKFENPKDDEALEVAFAFRDITGISGGKLDPQQTLSPGSFDVTEIDTARSYSVQFYLDAWSSEGEILEVFWSFGDGTVSQEFDPIHFYPFSDKDYEVCVNISYSNGCDRQQCLILNPSLQGKLDIELGITPEGYQSVTAVTDGIEVVSYDWGFESGLTSTEPSVAFIPDDQFSVERICLEVVDDEGKNYSICQDFIWDPNKGCAANFDSEVNEELAVSHGPQGEKVVSLELNYLGKIWTSAVGSDVIELLQSEEYERNEDGKKTMKLELTGDIDFSDGQGNFMNLIIDEATIAVGIK